MAQGCNLETWGTAFLIDGCGNGMLTAGHVCSELHLGCTKTWCDLEGQFVAIVEFNIVPPSLPDGTLVCAAPQDQYPLDPASIGPSHFQFGPGHGDDWCYFGVFDNPGTGLNPVEAQGDFYSLASAVPPADGSTLRITGYGIDNDPVGCCDPPTFVTCGLPACLPDQRNEHSGTQQTAAGPYAALTGFVLEYGVDTEGGNSGSAVEHVLDGLVYAIHTGGGCTSTGGTNNGTIITHPGLLAALADPIGVCGDCNDNGVPDIDDISSGTSADCNENHIPDSCDIFDDPALDSDSNGVIDTCETGACCLGGGACNEEVLESACVSSGGTFLGDDVLCGSSGVCCMNPFGNCVETNAECCPIGVGLFFVGRSCPFTCPSQQGPSQGP